MNKQLNKTIAKAIHGDKPVQYNSVEDVLKSKQLWRFAAGYLSDFSRDRDRYGDAYIGSTKQKFVKAIREHLVKLAEDFGMFPHDGLPGNNKLQLNDKAAAALKCIRYSDVAHLHTGKLDKQRVRKEPSATSAVDAAEPTAKNNHEELRQNARNTERGFLWNGGTVGEQTNAFALTSVDELAKDLRRRGFTINLEADCGEISDEETWSALNASTTNLLTYRDHLEIIKNLKLSKDYRDLSFKAILWNLVVKISEQQTEIRTKQLEEQKAAQKAEEDRHSRHKDLAHLAIRAMDRPSLVVTTPSNLVNSMTIWEYLRSPEMLPVSFNERLKTMASRSATIVDAASWRKADFNLFKASFMHMYKLSLRGSFTHAGSLLLQSCMNYYRSEFTTHVANGTSLKNSNDPSSDILAWYKAVVERDRKDGKDYAVAVMSDIAFATIVTRQILLDLMALTADVQLVAESHGDEPYDKMEVGEYRSRFKDLALILKNGREARPFRETYGKAGHIVPFSLAASRHDQCADLFDGEAGMAVALGQIDAFIATGRGDFDKLYRIVATANFMLEQVRGLLIGSVNESCKAKDHTQRMEEIEVVMTMVNAKMVGPKSSVFGDAPAPHARNANYAHGYVSHLNHPDKETYLPYRFKSMVSQLMTSY